MANPILTGIVFLAFNAPIMGFVAVVPFGRRLDEALQEKTITGDSSGVTSYARVTAALGAVILTAFFWALGNILLAHALSPTGTALIEPLLKGLWPFFLAGSAFFLPYAFNQLKSVFPWTARAATELAEAQARLNTIPTHYGADEVTRITIALLTPAITDAELRKVVDAITVQINQHFAPEWKHTALLSVTRPKLTAGKAPIHAATDAVIYIGETHTDPNTGAQFVQGYHDKNIAKKAYGFVYLDVCALYKEHWSVTLSHEVLELLADPTAIMTVDDGRPDGRPGARYALEVCDPTQGDHYDINGVSVCNFVTRQFFGAPGASPDMNYLKLPQDELSPRPKGYIQYSDASGVHQLWGKSVSSTQKAARQQLGTYRRNGRRAARMEIEQEAKA